VTLHYNFGDRYFYQVSDFYAADVSGDPDLKISYVTIQPTQESLQVRKSGTKKLLQNHINHLLIFY
jgi:hypothetical protein